MRNAIITAAIAALLATGSAATVSAMPATAPVPTKSLTGNVELVGHRHREGRRDRDFRHEGRRNHVLPARVIVRQLRHRGYSHIRSINFVRGDYVVIARGHRGPVRLVVDGRTGPGIARHRLRRGGGFRHSYGGNSGFSFSFGVN